MKLDLKEPICALITPAGTAAINVIRISGEGSIDIVATNFKPASRIQKARGYQIVHGMFLDKDAQPLDEVLCSVFKAPHSYTGDDTVEISCHGNPRIAARILSVLSGSARLARPGEFTLRAMHNHKLDLIQAEAINDLINAPTSKSGSAALSQTRGVLSASLKTILEAITQARLRCEMAIDFADQDLPQLDISALKDDIAALLAEVQRLCEDGQHGRYIRDGIRICLAGAPNSGKSSLFNAFLKQNRAIVTPHPGTTRDYLEETLSMKGYTLVLYDTAGLRDTADEIEKQGIDRSRELMREADLILHLIDVANAGPDAVSLADEIPEDIAGKVLTVISKADLLTDDALDNYFSKSWTPASAVTPGGLDRLAEAILDRFAVAELQPERPLITNTRHLAALQNCAAGLEKAVLALESGMGFEFAAFDLISASSALEEVLGVITPDELLNRIFADFCVGK